LPGNDLLPILSYPEPFGPVQQVPRRLPAAVKSDAPFIYNSKNSVIVTFLRDITLGDSCKELEIGSEKSSWLVFSEDKINQANGTRTCSMSLRLCELSQTRLGESHVHCADVGTIKKKKTKEMD